MLFCDKTIVTDNMESIFDSHVTVLWRLYYEITMNVSFWRVSNRFHNKCAWRLLADRNLVAQLWTRHKSCFVTSCDLSSFSYHLRPGHKTTIKVTSQWNIKMTLRVPRWDNSNVNIVTRHEPTVSVSLPYDGLLRIIMRRTTDITLWLLWHLLSFVTSEWRQINWLYYLGIIFLLTCCCYTFRLCQFYFNQSQLNLTFRKTNQIFNQE